MPIQVTYNSVFAFTFCSCSNQTQKLGPCPDVFLSMHHSLRVHRTFSPQHLAELPHQMLQTSNSPLSCIHSKPQPICSVLYLNCCFSKIISHFYFIIYFPASCSNILLISSQILKILILNYCLLHLFNSALSALVSLSFPASAHQIFVLFSCEIVCLLQVYSQQQTVFEDNQGEGRTGCSYVSCLLSMRYE